MRRVRTLEVLIFGGVVYLLLGGCACRSRQTLPDPPVETVVDELGSSKGLVGFSRVLDVTASDFMKRRYKEFASSNGKRVFTVRNKTDSILVNDNGHFYIIEDPTIRTDHAERIRLEGDYLIWWQLEQFTEVHFLFSFERHDFVYIRRTFRPSL